MFKFFSKRMNNKKGFTLIELIVVIAILAILALIAIPRVGKFRTQAAISSHNANVRTLESAATMYLAEHGLPGTTNVTWDASEEHSTWDGYLAAWPEIPNGLTLTSNTYSVTISETTDGKATVVVSPGLVDENGALISTK